MISPSESLSLSLLSFLLTALFYSWLLAHTSPCLSVLTQLQVYFEQFATKSCCFDDIKLFLNELSPEDTAKVDVVGCIYMSARDGSSISVLVLV